MWCGRVVVCGVVCVTSGASGGVMWARVCVLGERD